MAKKPKITTRGALLAVDVDAVDRVWTSLPAKDVIAGIRGGTLSPRPPSSGAAPFPPAEKKTAGLDVALAALTTKKTMDRPLAEGLKAKRALGIPWRWLSRAPDVKEEMRTDERLLRWAEISRVAEITADEILAVTSAVEREMVGASEVKAAFARWSTPEFAAKAAALAEAALADALVDAWDDLAPLLAALGYDEEPEMLAAIAARLRDVKALLAFAAAERYSVLPFLREPWDAWLQERAAARKS